MLRGMREESPPHICPRCGYDVSGVVPTWAESCPLQGTCSECGLVYEWVDVFRPERIYPAWSFEHARQGRSRALVRTIARIPTPGRLWRQMKLAAPVRVESLVLIAALAMIIGHVLVVGIRLGLSHRELWQVVRMRVGPTGAATSTTVFDWNALAMMALWPYSRGWDRLVGPLGLVLVVWAFLSPLPFFVLQQTMSRSKVRRAHLLRGWAYFLVMVCLILVGDALFMAVPTYVTGGTSVSPIWMLWVVLGLALFLGAAVLMVRWWWLFASAYLRLPRAPAVTAVMLAISLLGSVVVCLLLDSDTGSAVGWWLLNLLG